MNLDSVRVRGPFRGISGYDRHTRAFVRAFAQLGVRVQLEPLDEWASVSLPGWEQDPWFESLSRPIDTPVTLHFCMPHQLRLVPGTLNVNYTMFEATAIPGAWVAAARTVDLTIVPTPSSRAAWLASGVPTEKVAVSPLGVDAALPAKRAMPLPLIDDDGEDLADRRVRFLTVADINPRKNLDGLLLAWARATSPADDAVLILKLNARDPLRFERLWSLVAITLREAGLSLASAAPIHVVNAVFADAEMPRLYAAATHYISVSHGEGWDLPAAEAAAAGLRIIAPDHSAYRAYLDDSIAHLLPSRVVPAVTLGSSGLDPSLFGGLDWWAPDEGAATAAIRAAIDGTGPARLGAQQRLLTFSWESAARQLLDLVSAAVVRGPRQAMS